MKRREGERRREEEIHRDRKRMRQSVRVERERGREREGRRIIPKSTSYPKGELTHTFLTTGRVGCRIC